MDLLIERDRRRPAVAERLLDDDACLRGQPGVVQALDHRREQERRDLEVEDRPLGLAERRGNLLVGGVVGEVAGDVGQPCREAGERLVVDRLAGGGGALAGVVAQLLDAPVLRSDTDDRADQDAARLQPVQRPERHHARKITGDAEHHERVSGSGIALGRLGHRASTTRNRRDAGDDLDAPGSAHPPDRVMASGARCSMVGPPRLVRSESVAALADLLPFASTLEAARTQMAFTLAFHIILASLGVALPALMLIATTAACATTTPTRCCWLRGPSGSRQWAWPA